MYVRVYIYIKQHDARCFTQRGRWHRGGALVRCVNCTDKDKRFLVVCHWKMSVARTDGEVMNYNLMNVNFTVMYGKLLHKDENIFECDNIHNYFFIFTYQ